MRRRRLVPLSRSFYRRPADQVAQELLGHLLVRRLADERLVLRIVETEAYLGQGDRASHAWTGRPTPRTTALFRPGGCAYVYLVYGLHHMFNVVTGQTGDGSAVLIRAGEAVEGRGRMLHHRGLTEDSSAELLASGPGRLSEALAIGLEQNRAWLDRGELMVCRGEAIPGSRVAVGPRIGVGYAGEAADWPLRYAVCGSASVSRPRPPTRQAGSQRRTM